MLCPRDQSALQESVIREETVHLCPTCGGMYLEHGVLNRVAEPTEGDLEFSTIDMDSFQHEDDQKPIECPRDSGVRMNKVEFNIESDIILDYCATCEGFWVDRAEMSRINDEVKEYNQVAKEIPDPPMVRLAQFFWNLPFPH